MLPEIRINTFKLILWSQSETKARQKISQEKKATDQYPPEHRHKDPQKTKKYQE